MDSSIRDAILAADDLPSEVVPTPEWAAAGVPEVIVRGLSAAELDAYEQSLIEYDRKGKARQRRNVANIRALFVAQCVIDDKGQRVFSDGDVALLGKKSGLVIDRLWDVARRLSGKGEETEEEEGQEPALVEGFDSAQDEISSSG